MSEGLLVASYLAKQANLRWLNSLPTEQVRVSFTCLSAKSLVPGKQTGSTSSFAEQITSILVLYIEPLWGDKYVC